MVTESADPLFLPRLTFEAQRLGLWVVQRLGSFETTVVNFDLQQPEAGLLPPSSRPPVDITFRIRIEIPTGYPPEAAAQLSKGASQLERELRRRLGYPTRKRLRTSLLVAMAEDLKVAKGPLERKASYEIIDEIFKDEEGPKDQKRRQLIKSRRRKLKKRLVEPYQQDTGPAQ